MRGYFGRIEELTRANENFRQVLYTARHSQLVLMCLKSGEEIGEEVHEVDQFFRFEQGSGQSIVDGTVYDVKDGDCVIVPAGAKHNVINTSQVESLKLYTLYSPANHRDGVTATTKAEAEDHEEHFDGRTTEV